MDKFLYFSDGDAIDAAGDFACIPLSRFIGFTIANGATDGTSLGMNFKPSSSNSATANEVDRVDLTITANTHKKVINSICKAINAASFADNSGFIVVADALGGVFADPDITACALAIDA